MKKDAVDFKLPHRVALEYENAIRTIARHVLPLRAEGQTLGDWLRRITERQFSEEIQEASQMLAERMVHWVNVRNVRTWRQAAERSSKSRQLHALLAGEMQGPVGARVRALVRENAAYISSVPLHAAEVLEREVLKAQQNGARPETIAKMMRVRFPELLRSRVNLIARTESSKVSAALTSARAEHLNLPCYIWRTAEDARVRQSHRRMDGVVCFYAHPPNPETLSGLKNAFGPYNAGEAPNDRCTQIVLLSADDVKFPRRVAFGNNLRSMNKQEFKTLVTQYA